MTRQQRRRLRFVPAWSVIPDSAGPSPCQSSIQFAKSLIISSRVAQEPGTPTPEALGQPVDRVSRLGRPDVEKRPRPAIQAEGFCSCRTETASVRDADEQLVEPVGSVAPLLVAFGASNGADFGDCGEDFIADSFNSPSFATHGTMLRITPSWDATFGVENHTLGWSHDDNHFSPRGSHRGNQGWC